MTRVSWAQGHRSPGGLATGTVVPFLARPPGQRWPGHYSLSPQPIPKTSHWQARQFAIETHAAPGDDMSAEQSSRDLQPAR